MTHTPNPTPGPWAYQGVGDTFVISAKHYPILGRADNLANAAFIVRAVNNHDALVTALKSAENWLLEFHGGVSEDEGLNGLLIDLRAAIAAAMED